MRSFVISCLIFNSRSHKRFPSLAQWFLAKPLHKRRYLYSRDVSSDFSGLCKRECCWWVNRCETMQGSATTISWTWSRYGVLTPVDQEGQDHPCAHCTGWCILVVVTLLMAHCSLFRLLIDVSLFSPVMVATVIMLLSFQWTSNLSPWEKTSYIPCSNFTKSSVAWIGHQTEDFASLFQSCHMLFLSFNQGVPVKWKLSWKNMQTWGT